MAGCISTAFVAAESHSGVCEPRPPPEHTLAGALSATPGECHTTTVVIALVVALLAAAALCALIVVEIRRVPPPLTPARVPLEDERRDVELESRIATALEVPRAKFGEVFSGYSVWRSDREVRLELVAADPWKVLNEFTRCIIVRYLWRILETMSEGAVVVVDAPRQRWTKATDERFHDHGVDPLLNPFPAFAGGPQFAKDL